jgi:hypothetical protein
MVGFCLLRNRIKFATDLVVFPLLWLYRLARVTKRKFLRLLGRGKKGKKNKNNSSSHPGDAINGSSGPNGSSSAVDWKNLKPNGEQ